MPRLPKDRDMKMHYLEEIDIKNLKKNIENYRKEFKLHCQDAKDAEAAGLYDDLDSDFVMISEAADRCLNANLVTYSESLLQFLRGGQSKMFRFIGKMVGIDEKVTLTILDKSLKHQPLTAEEEKENEKISQAGHLYEFYSYLSQSVDNLEKQLDHEAEEEEKNHAAELEAINKADVASQALGTTDRLKAVVPFNTSGNGYLYDTLKHYMDIIDSSSNLQILAGKHYRKLVDCFTTLRPWITVPNYSRASYDSLYAITNKLGEMEDCLSELSTQTTAFEGMRDFILKERAYINNASAGMLIIDVLNHRAPKPEPEGYRKEAKDAVIKEDMKTLLNTTMKGLNRYEDLENRLDLYLDKYVFEMPYMVDGQAYSGNELRAKLSNYAPSSFQELNRPGNGGSPIIAALEGRGISRDQMYCLVEGDPNSQQTQVMRKLVDEARKEVFDIAFTEKNDEIDEKESELLVNALVSIEKRIEDLVANPTMEALAKFASQAKIYHSVLLQGMPQHAYNSKGELMVEPAIDRKLKELGKPYSFEQIYSVLRNFSDIRGAVHELGAGADGNVKLDGAMDLLFSMHLLQEECKELQKANSIAEGIAAYDRERYITKRDRNTIETVSDVDQYFSRFSDVFADMCNWSEIRTPDKLLDQMKAQRDENGASKEFSAVLNALEEVTKEQHAGLYQHYVNETYDKLEKACETYLSSRNPSREPGKERYKLITRIEQMVDHSKMERTAIETEQQKTLQQKKNEKPSVFSGQVAAFSHATQSIFGDSAEMAKIKTLANELVDYQNKGMNMVAYAGEVNLYNLYKACADYLGNPKKANNARREAVATLASEVRNQMGILAENERNKTTVTEIPKIADRGIERSEIAQRLAVFDTLRQERIADAEQQQKQAIYELDVSISENYAVLDKIAEVESDVNINGLFAPKFVQNPEMKKAGVYNLSGKTYQPKSFELSDDALAGLAYLGLEEADFSHIAYMDYILNSHDDGLVKQKFKGNAYLTCKALLNEVHDIVIGTHFNANMISSLSKDGEGFANARENTNFLLQKIGINGDITPVAVMMAKMLKTLNLTDVESDKNLSSYVARRAYIGRVMKMLDHSPQLTKAVLETGLVREPDLERMRGYAKEAELVKDAVTAKIKVLSVKKNGGRIAPQELRECYKTILKAGLPYGEDISETFKEMFLKQYEAEIAIDTERKGQLEAAMPSKDNEIKQLTESVKALENQYNDVVAYYKEKLNAQYNQNNLNPDVALKDQVALRNKIDQLAENRMDGVQLDEVTSMLQQDDKKKPKEISTLMKQIENLKQGAAIPAKQAELDKAIQEKEALSAEYQSVVNHINEQAAYKEAVTNRAIRMTSLANYISAENGMEKYDAIIEKLIPADITQDKVTACADKNYSFETEYVQAYNETELSDTKLDLNMESDWPLDENKQNDEIHEERDSLNRQEQKEEKQEVKLPEAPKPVPKGKDVSEETATKMDKIIADGYALNKYDAQIRLGTYMDVFFGANIERNKETYQTCMNEHCYAFDGVTPHQVYNPPKINLDDEAVKKGFDRLGIPKELFADLAYMEYMQNNYSIESRQNLTKDENVDMTMVLGLTHGNVLGVELRAGFMGSINLTQTAYVKARENVFKMIQQVGRDGNIRPIAERYAKMLALLKPAAVGAKDFCDKNYVAERTYIGHLMDVLGHNKQLAQAVLDTKIVKRKDLRLMRGYGREMKYQQERNAARIKIASAVKSGVALSNEEMRQCYRAILKSGLLWRESVVLATENESLTEKAIAEIAPKHLATSDKLKPIFNKRKLLLTKLVGEKAWVKIDQLTGNRREEALNQYPGYKALLQSKEWNDLKIAQDNVQAEIDALNHKMGYQKNIDHVKFHPLHEYLGMKDGRANYEKIIDQMIPVKMNMDRLARCADSYYQFEKEYKLAIRIAAKDLDNMKQPSKRLGAKQKQDMMQDKGRMSNPVERPADKKSEEKQSEEKQSQDNKLTRTKSEVIIFRNNL